MGLPGREVFILVVFFYAASSYWTWKLHRNVIKSHGMVPAVAASHQEQQQQLQQKDQSHILLPPDQQRQMMQQQHQMKQLRQAQQQEQQRDMEPREVTGAPMTANELTHAGLFYERNKARKKLEKLTQLKDGKQYPLNDNGVFDFPIKMPEDVPSMVDTLPRDQIVDFEQQEGVVIAVKIHGHSHNIIQLKQSLCLLTAAYNYRVQYDVIVFTTDPLDQETVDHLTQIVAPADLKVIIDSKPLAQKIEEDLTEEQREKLFKLCGSRDVNTYYWKQKCQGETWVLGYNWQAEFRSIQIWSHPALSPYRYMLWFDSDALPTEAWKTDPVANFIRNDLVILFDNMQAGAGEGREHTTTEAYGRMLCKIRIGEDGKTWEDKGKCNKGVRPGSIHGFFHITNLDWYRQPHVQQWMHVLFEDRSMLQVANDQIAVTIPYVILYVKQWWFGVALTCLFSGY